MKKEKLTLRKVCLLLGIGMMSTLGLSQMQVGNSDFENWENVGEETEEPENWNSFMSADCTMSSFFCDSGQGQRVERSTDAHSGEYSARVWSEDVFGIAVANGNLTLGRVHMGSPTADNPSNYNYTDTENPTFNQPFTGMPDSLAVWVKYTAQSSSSEARISATIHDDYDYRDPSDSDAEAHIVAQAVHNYSPTNGEWVRISVPFEYTGPATEPAYILITFASNSEPGGGAGGDEVLIDDLEMIYNEVIENEVVINPGADQELFIGEAGNELTVSESGSEVASREWKYSTTSGEDYVSFDPVETEENYTPLFDEEGTYYVVCETVFENDETLLSNEVKIEVTKSVGIAEENNVNIHVYGSEQNIVVDLSNLSMDAVNMKLYSMDGRLIQTNELKGKEMNTVSTTATHGIYIYHLENGSAIYTGKIYLQ